MKLRHLGVFGLFERFSMFSTVVFNAVLGTFLLKGAFPGQEQQKVHDTLSSRGQHHEYIFTGR